MKEYKILKRGRENRVLVEWVRENKLIYKDGKEYSVHTLGLDKNLIWGHYYLKLEDAEEHFKQYQY